MKNYFSIVKNAYLWLFLALGITLASWVLFIFNAEFSEEFTGGVSIEFQGQVAEKEFSEALVQGLQEKGFPKLKVNLDQTSRSVKNQNQCFIKRWWKGKRTFKSTSWVSYRKQDRCFRWRNYFSGSCWSKCRKIYAFYSDKSSRIWTYSNDDLYDFLFWNNQKIHCARNFGFRCFTQFSFEYKFTSRGLWALDGLRFNSSDWYGIYRCHSNDYRIWNQRCDYYLW